MAGLSYKKVLLKELAFRTQALIDNLDNQKTLKYPIYILSKARSHYRLFPDLLDEHRVDYRIVVEPQDTASYEARFPGKVITLPLNDQGISYARNFAKQHSSEAGFSFHWQMDDDFTAIRVRQDGKSVVIDPRNAFSVVEQTADMFTNIGAVGLAHSAYVFSYDNAAPVVHNTMMYGIMLLNNDVYAQFRNGVAEDTDYSLQMLTEGFVTLSFKRLSFDTAPSGSMTGGNTEISYFEDNRRKRFEAVVQLWPDRYKVGYHKNGLARLVPLNPYRGFVQLPIPATQPFITWAQPRKTP